MTSSAVDLRRPNLFIVGAPKAGTTSLHRYLQEHPAIYMSREKEPGYFAPDITGTRPRLRFKYGDDETEYLRLFPATDHEAWVGESSTHYLMSHEAPRLISEFDPSARAIVMIRNPVDLVHSLHTERVSTGSEWITDFAEAIEADHDRRNGERLPKGLAGLGVAYRDNAMLGEQLERWQNTLGSERVHVVVFDDFARDTPAAYRKVVAFLGVDPSFAPAEFVNHNPSHRRRNGAIRLALRNPVTRWASRTAMPRVLGERRTAKLQKRFSRRRVTRQTIVRDEMPERLRKQLELEFTPDVRRLGDLIGRDLAAEWFTNGGSAR